MMILMTLSYLHLTPAGTGRAPRTDRLALSPIHYGSPARTKLYVTVRGFLVIEKTQKHQQEKCMQSLAQLPADSALQTEKIFLTKISNQNQPMKDSNACLKSGFEIVIFSCTIKFLSNFDSHDLHDLHENFEPLSKLNLEALDQLWILMNITIRKSYMQLPRKVMRFSKSKFLMFTD